MSSKPYLPNPVATNAVALSPELEDLTERLAENAHDLWAKERLAQGWQWGPKRDDELKQHPCLIPYSSLSEHEKTLDREASMGTLRAALAMGVLIETSASPLNASAQKSADNWENRLKQSAAEIKAEPKNLRRLDFDMNDQAELDSGSLVDFPALQNALQSFQSDLYPDWSLKDTEANSLRKTHRKVAWWAIIAGVAAILLAITQLALLAFLKNPEAPILHFLTWMELGAATISATAVSLGFLAKTRNRWLAARQAAERMRMLKFRALTDANLWCDFEKWKNSWQPVVAELRDLKFEKAERWVQSGSAEPILPDAPTCPVGSAEVRAIADYYLTKRHWFQRHYFRSKAREHRRDTWALRLHLPVGLFFASVLFVIIHVGMELPKLLAPKLGTHAAVETSQVGHSDAPGQVTSLSQKTDWEKQEVLASVLLFLALAAALPIVGFGLRAWFSAFELPRRAQLFNGKAGQLKEAIKRAKEDRLHARKTFTHIELGEHFYENEHREWCRLILEAEWFV